MATEDFLRIGAGSWKEESWQGLIYPVNPRGKEINYLREYASHYSTVEVDQWFWSLFGDFGEKIVLPKTDVVNEYAQSVPPGFLFSIKVPNSITLTHLYTKKKNDPLVVNPHFLSTELMEKFMKRLEPLGDHIGPLMFQFEYLNKKKMAGLYHFLELFAVFRQGLPEGYRYCLEIRNPNYLTNEYFDFLAEQRLGHVFLQGYYMPSIFSVYEQFKDRLSDPVVLRLLGFRKGIEERAKDAGDTIVKPRDDELLQLKSMVDDLRERRRLVFVNVKNQYEGCAPLTIERIKALFGT